MKTLSDAAKSAMKTGREKLGPGGPRARGEEKMRVALDWIYRWGWASPTTIELITGGNKSNLVTRLVNNKILRSTVTEYGGGLKGIPRQLLTLTSIGLDEAERIRETLIEYELDSYKIDQTKLRHDQLSQQATANSLLAGTTISFKTPNELAEQSAKNIKQPDVLWVTKDNQRIGVEIELSAKWDRKLDQFVLSCIESMKPPAKVDIIALITNSPAIEKRYIAAFTPGARLPVWSKNERGFWSQSHIETVPPWIDGKVICRIID